MEKASSVELSIQRQPATVSVLIDNKAQADMLEQLLAAAAAKGPDARTLADLYDKAKTAKEFFDKRQ